MTITADFVAVNPLSPQPAKRTDGTHYRIVPARYPLRKVGTFLALALILAVAHSTITNERWGWPVFAEWFFAEPILVGLSRTLLLTFLGTFFGFALGTLLALARVSGSPLLAGVSWVYVWIFRSIPLIVLLLLLNNLGYLYETIRLGVPFTDITFASWQTTLLITPFFAAVLGLGLHAAAFSSEIVRGGILSVDQGQLEAAAALGLPRRHQATRIVLPQAMRSILPGGFNEVIMLAKGSSQVYILALPELFYTVQVIYRRNLEVIPLLMVATVWYLVILSVLSTIQFFIERHYAKGALRNQPSSVFRYFLKDKPVDKPAGAARVTSTPAAPVSSGRAGDGWAARTAPGGAVSIQNVSKSFGDLRVLRDVSLEIPAGSVTAILGQSGSGKSTLLRTINHLESVDDGIISVDGKLIGYQKDGDTLFELKEPEILKRRADVGMVFQNFNLFPHMTVLENIVDAPITVRGLSKAEAEALAYELLDRVGLSDKAQCLSAPIVRRPAAARRHSAGAGAQAQGSALRRADVGARPGTGQRGA